jgi:preprotein translocase subunit YajC
MTDLGIVFIIGTIVAVGFIIYFLLQKPKQKHE